MYRMLCFPFLLLIILIYDASIFFFSNAGTGNKDYQSFKKRIGILNNNVMWKKQILENYVTLLFCLWGNGQINNLMLQKKCYVLI